jgi:hypothetical protein
LQQKVLAECSYVASGGDPKYLKTVNDINEYFVSLAKPENLDIGSIDSAATKFEVQFEELVVGLQVAGIQNVKKMNVIEFYSAIVYFESKAKKTAK